MQYVRVEVSEGRAYTYEWDDLAFGLMPGDTVVLPSNLVQDKEFEGRVIRLLDKPDTDIPLKRIIRRVP